MTLEEAIKHYEKVAEKNEKQAKECHDNQVRKCEVIPFAEMDYTRENECLECAKEHRQLAEWLKALKEIWDSGDCNDCLHSKNCTIRPKLGQMVRYNCYQYERRIDEEVNVDDN